MGIVQHVPAQGIRHVLDSTGNRQMCIIVQYDVSMHGHFLCPVLMVTTGSKKNFTTVMVLSSISISESSLQRGFITGCCFNRMSVVTMLWVSISFQEQSFTNYSHLARSTEETNMTTVNGSFNQ
jgi:hypothetical protein